MSFKMPQWAYGASIVVGGILLMISFQNCSPGGFQTLGASQEASLSSASDDNAGTEENIKKISGYIFSASYRSSASDLSGVMVCEYPGNTNCKTDADGKSKGRMQVHDSGLAVSAPLHKLAFKFYSDGYFAKNREAHFAIGLRGNVTHENGDPVAVNGRGFIIGQLGGDSRNAGNPACSRDMAQIETYSGDAGRGNPALPWNHIFSESCSDAIFKDGQWYTLELYVSSDRKIGYKVFDNNGALVYSHLLLDPYNYLNPNLSDWFMGHVFDTPVTSANGNWSIIVKDITLSQSNDPIEKSFITPLMTFSHLGKALQDGAVVSLAEMTNESLVVGDFPSLRTRVFGCAGPTSAVDAGACSKAHEFRVIDFSGDGAFRKVGSKLSVLDGPIYQYPNNLYKLILRVNPQSPIGQATVRVLKQ